MIKSHSILILKSYLKIVSDYDPNFKPKSFRMNYKLHKIIIPVLLATLLSAYHNFRILLNSYLNAFIIVFIFVATYPDKSKNHFNRPSTKYHT